MSDIFDETEENLRADKWVSLVKKALPWVSAVLGGALIIALSVWGWQSWQSHVNEKASEAFEAAVETNAKGDKVAAKAKFEDVTKSGSGTYKALALMELGALASDDGLTAEAIKDFDEAAKVTSSPITKDTAAIKAAFLSMDTASYAEMEKRLTPLIKEDRPVAPLAKEALAMAKLQAGDIKGARADLQVLSLTLGVPDGIKQRAGNVVEAIDSGAIDTAKTVMKQPEAKMPTLPPAQAPMPGMPTQ